MRYGRPTVRWISPALALLSCFAFAFFTKSAAAQSILPSFNKPGVLVSDAAILSDGATRLDQPVWLAPCIPVSDVPKFGKNTLVISGVLVSDGPVVIDCIVVIESDEAEQLEVCQFRCPPAIAF